MPRATLASTETLTNLRCPLVRQVRQIRQRGGGAGVGAGAGAGVVVGGKAGAAAAPPPPFAAALEWEIKLDTGWRRYAPAEEAILTQSYLAGTVTVDIASGGKPCTNP